MRKEEERQRCSVKTIRQKNLRKIKLQKEKAKDRMKKREGMIKERKKMKISGSNSMTEWIKKKKRDEI